MPATPMENIERRAALLAETRKQVADIVLTLQESIDLLKKEQMPALKAAVRKMAERHDQLKALIEQNPDLFVKPRTTVFHGIKVGLEKGKGALNWDKDERVVKAIKRLMPEQVSVLINTTEKPSKSALQGLPADELKKLGINVTKTGDQVVIKATDKDVDKLVDALFKGATEDDDE